MNEQIKKIFLAGLGATLLSKEKATQFLNDLSKSGSVAANETKNFVDKLTDQGQTKKNQLQDDMKTTIKGSIEELGFVTKEDYQALKAQVTALEEKLAALSGPEVSESDK